jgi:5-methylcytosine-specific restriction endonuclease McrA
MIDDDPVPDSMRYRVLMRDKQRCLLCGATAKDTRLYVDHIVPRSKGGSNTLDNLQTLCFECNGGKNNKDDTDFREAAPPVLSQID